MDILLFFLIGAILGSIVNVVVFRTAKETSLIRGRSQCMMCEAAIHPKDLIPILSYIRLKSRCRSCNQHISLQYPLVELNMALLAVLVYVRYATGYSLPSAFDPALIDLFVIRDLLFIMFLFLIFTFDLRFMRIPQRFTIPAAAVALVMNLWIGVTLKTLLFGAVVAGGFFLAQHILSRGKWIGTGDVAFGVVVGCMLGTCDTITALVLAYILGAGVGIILLARKKLTLKSQVPFGVFLAYATGMALFFGQVIVDWYTPFLLRGF